MDAIHEAAWEGDVAAVDLLVAEDGGRLNARNQEDLGIDGIDFRECTPLMFAVYRGHDAVVARLLALGADVGLQSHFGCLAPHWACYGKQSSSLALLLDAGASMDARGYCGMTPLMAAAEEGATDCVTLLLARLGDGMGEQLGMADNFGESAAHLACCYNHHSTLALLLDAGASMDARNNRGMTPLMVAAAQGAADCVTMLLARLGGGVGEQLGMVDNDGFSAAHLAYHYNRPSTLALLLNAGASMTVRDTEGRTPLMVAAESGATNCVTLLLARLGDGVGAQLGMMDNQGNCAAHLACCYNHPLTLALLLNAGADPTIRDNDGDTALDIAQAQGHQECIALLEAALAELQRSRLLFKARALIAVRRTVAAAEAALASKGVPTVLHRGTIAMAVPFYLAGRVAQAQELLRVSITHHDDEDDEEEEEKLAACLKYALGLEGGGGVVLEGREPAVGLPSEVFVELLELLVPKCDPAQRGRPLGQGV